MQIAPGWRTELRLTDLMRFRDKDVQGFGSKIEGPSFNGLGQSGFLQCSLVFTPCSNAFQTKVLPASLVMKAHSDLYLDTHES